MKVRTIPLTLALLLVGCSCLAQELLPNRGFEQVQEGKRLPAQWTARGTTLPAHKLVPEPRSGKWAAEIAFAEGEGNKISGYYYSDPQPLPACKRVTVSAYVRVGSEGKGQGAFLRLMFQKGDAYIGLHNSSALKDSGGDWQRLEVSAAPPAEADSWRMSVEFQGIGRAVFDDCAAELEPLDLLPAATLEAPAGIPMDLGDERFGILGRVSAPIERSQIISVLKGRSALPPTIHVGAVWYQGEEQLGVAAVAVKAWQAPTEASMPVRALAGADALRPIAYADSREAWDAAEVALPTIEPAKDGPAPAAITPAPHPRLFITQEELAHLRELLKGDPPEQLADLYKQVLSVADKCFEEKEIVVYSGRYKTSLPPAVPRRHEDSFPYWTGLSRAIEVRIEALATAYLLSGERRYADLAKSWVLALCEWPQWTDPDYPSRDACLDTGHFCHAVAFTYDFIYDVLTEEERETIRDALLEKGAEAVMRAGEKGWARTMRWPNGFAVVMGGMGIAGIATLGDDDRAAEYVQYARRRLWEFLEVRDRDGGYVEGLVYGGYAMSLTMPFAGTLSLHGDSLLVDHPYIGKTLRFATYCLDPNSATSVNFSDSTYTARDYNSLAGWRARNGDGLAQWYLQHNTGLGSLWQYTPPLAVLWHPLHMPDRNVGPTLPPLPDRNVGPTWSAAAHYRDIGWTILRSGFGPGDFVFAMRSGYHGSHCQLDQNSFMLNVGGQWLLTDPGYGRRPTELHSTLIVAGKGQSPAGGSVEAFGSVGKIVYAAGDAAACYDGLSRFTRHVVMVDKSYLVVVDELAPAEGPVEIEAQLVTGVEEPQVEDDRVVLALEDSRCDIVLGDSGDLVIVGKQGPKKLRASFTLEAPSLYPMLIAPEAEEQAGEFFAERGAGAVHMRIINGDRTNHIFLNLTGSPETIGDITSDARLLWVRVSAGKIEDWSAVWGTRAEFNGETLFDKPQKGDERNEK